MKASKSGANIQKMFMILVKTKDFKAKDEYVRFGDLIPHKYLSGSVPQS